uniref:Alpha- and gamma-adaptin-binding protein p34-like n=1 Tax=Crassostrea virginica TaxID=6565 RepID=A0A8B8DN74_CRAVI|nr:alpha- and gamma-adaptin-binding protein p34-like [Crassostrea virginica]
MSFHSALFTSCCNLFDPNLLIKDILEVEKLPPSNKEIEDIVSYDWKIDTKYYTAEIKLCSTTKRTVGTEEFADGVQAVVIYFNADQVESFTIAKSWLPYVKEISPAVQILVCRNIPNSQAGHRHDVQTWCLDNDFELVELEAEVGSEEDDEFQETTGIKRIVQALHSHMWPNMVLKENQHTVSPYMRKLMEEESVAKSKQKENNGGKEEESSTSTEDISSEIQNSNGIGNVKTEKKSSPESKKELSSTSEESASGTDSKISQKSNNEDTLLASMPEDNLAAMLSLCAEEEEEEESFEQLFSKFKLMKEKAESLPQDQKKKYAEKVTIAFWKAIGGDEDELGDLSDLSDTEIP